VYWLPLSQAETNCNAGAVVASSTTSGVQLDPVIFYTQGGAIPFTAAGSPGGLPLIGSAPPPHPDPAASTRSTYAGGPVAGVSAPVTVGTNNDKAGYQLDLNQPLADAQSATVGGALAGAWTSGWGKVVKDVSNKLLKVWGPGNSTGSPSRSF